MSFRYLYIIIVLAALSSQAQSQLSQTWVSDQGNGTYKNPVLHADYSDPDAIRVGDDYYMISSSFEDIPGLPVLHSRDLVNWNLIGHALKQLQPADHYSTPQHGGGVWAPSIRFHKNKYFIYFPDPDFGIYMVNADHPAGPWSDPVLVEKGKGLIDPCPLWDDDGKVYLVHAFAGSRAGIKSILVIKQMNEEGTKTIDNGVMVYNGHDVDPTVEGPKIYKRNKWYYIFAPAGGVSTGWQLVLRSKNIYGPYERKVVMDKGNTEINGPHQGAWVNTKSGEDWFLHFQDKEVYGRVVHLQPMQWKNNWPVIGIDKDGDGKGEPVVSYKKPWVSGVQLRFSPPESDEFNSSAIGLQWQWMSNPLPSSAFPNPSKGVLTLFAKDLPSNSNNLWMGGNVLLQKFPAEEFSVTTAISFHHNKKTEGEYTGMIVMGTDFGGLALKSTKNGLILVYMESLNAGNNLPATEKIILENAPFSIFLRTTVIKGGRCSFSYSLNGVDFTEIDKRFIAKAGKWKGAKIGIFCYGNSITNDAGYSEFDWLRVKGLTKENEN